MRRRLSIRARVPFNNSDIRWDVALTATAAEGEIFVRGQYWRAVSVEAITAGRRVVVTAGVGLKLAVEPTPARTGG